MSASIGSVGFIGLGDMGAKQAHELAKLPLPLTVFDVRAEAMKAFEGKARLARSIAELGAASELVGLCVLTEEQVRAAVEELLPVMRAGSVILIHSTVSPESVREIAAHAKRGGIEVRDAPVTRTRMTEGGPFVFCPIGGDEALKARVQPILDAFATDTLLAGPIGSAMALKICNNLVSWCEIVVGLEAVALAKSAGIAPGKLLGLMGTNGILTPPMKMFANFSLQPGDERRARMIENAAHQGEKDLRLAEELARGAGSAVPMASFARGIVEQALRAINEQRRDPMESLYGNTLVVKSARGNARLWYDADGTFSGVDDQGGMLAGTWTIDGVSLCTVLRKPEPRPPHRGTLEPHAVGDAWEDHRADGTTTVLRIEAGR